MNISEEAVENVIRGARRTWRAAAERDERTVRTSSERRLRDVRPRSHAPLAVLALAVVLLCIGVAARKGATPSVAIEPDPSSAARALTAPVEIAAPIAPPATAAPAPIASSVPPPPRPHVDPPPPVSALPPLPPPPPPPASPDRPRTRLWVHPRAVDAIDSARIAAEIERRKAEAARPRKEPKPR